MIEKLSLTNFKSHKLTDLDFSNLTVLCGTNGVGKSSIIHALLLLRESFLAKSNFDYLDLKANSVNIGTVKDALYQNSEHNNILFGLKINKVNLAFEFNSSDADLAKSYIYKLFEAKHFSENNILEQESIFNQTCQFISAARSGPKDYYPKDDVVVDVYKQISVIQGQAEHFVHYLNTYKDFEVMPDLLNDNIKYSDLFNQTTAWEREISEGVNIVVKDLGNLGYELLYQFNTDSKNGKTNEFKSSNVGFGLTYVMPIIVAILSSKPGTLLLIENPEAHLHPSGQSKLAELICLAAQAGIQIILETHSDHIINGILVQSRKYSKEQKGISSENVSIYHFQRDEQDHCSVVKKVGIDEEQRIKYAPQGFFDQFSIDRKYLLGF